MPEAVLCPYTNGSGYCYITGTSQGDYQRENYCCTEKSKENWRSCANYQGASDKDKVEKRQR
jgi:hypothetical protein